MAARCRLKKLCQRSCLNGYHQRACWVAARCRLRTLCQQSCLNPLGLMGKRYAGVFACGFVLPMMFYCLPATAVMKIEVSSGIQGGIPVAVMPFANDPSTQRSFSDIIAADLSYSGLFSVIANEELVEQMSLPPSLTSTDAVNIDYAAWLQRGVEKLILGELIQSADGQLTGVHFALYDIAQRKRLFVRAIDEVRSVSASAHLISDQVYVALTGIAGFFSTRLAYVGVDHLSWREHRYTLYVSDADGHHLRAIYRSDHELMSPSWSPDASHLAYVSFEHGQPTLYIQTIATAKRIRLAVQPPAYAPSWSPDGRHVAYVSSAAGNPDIYIINLHTQESIRVTDNSAIDTEPVWSANNRLIFTSNRSAYPQLYELDKPMEGVNRPRRITYGAGRNSDADWSPRGEHLAYLHQNGESYAIVARYLADDKEVRIDVNASAEQPRFLPNGQLLSYLSSDDQYAAIHLVTLNGVPVSTIATSAKLIRSLAWAPIQP